jgi:hypothetical protein
VKWVKVVEVVVVAVAVVEAGRAGWAVRSLLVPGGTVYVPAADTRNHTWQGSRATRKSAPSAARRWLASGRMELST